MMKTSCLSFLIILNLVLSINQNGLWEVKCQGAVEIPPDTEEPEEPPATTTSSVDYSIPLAEAQAKIDSLQKDLQDLRETLLNRINNLETNYYNVLSDKVTALDTNLNGKVTDLAENLVSQTTALSSDIDKKVGDLSTEINDQLTTLNTDLTEMITNETLKNQQLISKLETGKVQMLITYNNLWRKNFRLINSTLVKLKQKANIQSMNSGRRIVIG